MNSVAVFWSNANLKPGGNLSLRVDVQADNRKPIINDFAAT